MTTLDPLHGAELIDCARANGTFGVQVAAERCGYGHSLEEFEQALKQACDSIGVEFRGFNDLVKPLESEQDLGVVIAPDTTNQL
ncbi:MAG: hypothetical protein K6T90_21165 [Leptolyngbyaceae cyanobacterium HOT.MB2.61]|jgi:hypothetical protein|nr:hypothetical protein [Leptolyngbyaceae cyanobacterium HOT.MB2.61]